ncbi:DUF262 domain-containing protein [Mucilaginibacter sp. cycad4]|uniref:DUF262 domain-containing protein n=1 Tax=Mucilaginibacter sp. cycad4 TaxID=3342096 RepID=UPI002AAAC6EF|nr:DUF262 domain-containing protein [Mucilaginibacter gossypii]WPV00584.1 DUF262 domain-containing protein [Mucilaginibacter gossypii]
MKKILGAPKSIRELFTGVKYSIHYYQREYQWERKQIEELIEDLTGEFLEYYSDDHERQEVEKYGHYFMGSVVLTEDENAIIDGQQRLTSLALLLIYLTLNLKDEHDKAEVLNLIHSQKYGKTTFNINVEERNECLESILDGKEFELNNRPESVKNIWNRYNDIKSLMIDAVSEQALPYFKDWIIDNVQFIRIEAQTEQDAHKIFVSMNDRGLSLTATEMLKGYLLSEIADDNERQKANELWKNKILELKALGKEQESDCIKTWLRSQYAVTIRERKKNAQQGDFDKISNAFHKWVRENSLHIGLQRSNDFNRFVQKEFILFADTYIRIFRYSNNLTAGFEHVFYNANRNFTLQPLLILAAITPTDSKETVDKKIRTVSCFLDQFISIRIFNFKTLDYSAMTYAMFTYAKKVRRNTLPDLSKFLTKEIANYEFKLSGINSFNLNGWTKRYMLHQLARLTHFVEKQSGRDTKFETYVDRWIKNPYDIEHVISDHYRRYKDEYESEESFQNHRNMFGALVLLPQDINRSLNDSNYDKKLDKYYSQNLLAASLNEKTFKNNPHFLKFIEAGKLKMVAVPSFKKAVIKERQSVYLELAKLIWDVKKINEFSL